MADETSELERPKRGRPKADGTVWVYAPVRWPADMLSRIKARADMAHRSFNWEVILLMERAFEQIDAEEHVPARRRSVARN